MSDKRSVATDALETLGTIIGEGAGRDAIHLAVDPVEALEELQPGQDVGLWGNRTAGHSDNPVGIVDPFLKQVVKPGERFWLVVYPRQITSLRHVWEHPAFPVSTQEKEFVPTEEQKALAKKVAEHLTGASEVWLRDWCSRNDSPDYEDLIDAVRNGGNSSSDDGEYGLDIGSEYITVYGTDAHGGIPPEFWDHIENVTGIKQVNRPTGFTCSC